MVVVKGVSKIYTWVFGRVSGRADHAFPDGVVDQRILLPIVDENGERGFEFLETRSGEAGVACELIRGVDNRRKFRECLFQT